MAFLASMPAENLDIIPIDDEEAAVEHVRAAYKRQGRRLRKGKFLLVPSCLADSCRIPARVVGDLQLVALKPKPYSDATLPHTPDINNLRVA